MYGSYFSGHVVMLEAAMVGMLDDAWGSFTLGSWRGELAGYSASHGITTVPIKFLWAHLWELARALLGVFRSLLGGIGVQPGSPGSFGTRSYWQGLAGGFLFAQGLLWGIGEVSKNCT